jgi:hypothetical protein
LYIININTLDIFVFFRAEKERRKSGERAEKERRKSGERAEKERRKSGERAHCFILSDSSCDACHFFSGGAVKKKEK